MNCKTHLSWHRFYRMPILWLFWKIDGAAMRCQHCKKELFGEWL